jgi:uroporphyrinogen-III synthase
MKPLAHHGVVVTRAEPDNGALARRLEERGARVVRWTAVQLAPPGDPRPLEAALAELDRFDWLIATSAHAANVVTSRAVRPPSLRIATVGAATAAELEAAGWKVDLVGPGPGAEALVAALALAGVGRGARALFPASAIARDALADGLEELGVEVERVEAYRTLPASLDVGACFAQLDAGAVDAVTFASPSAVDGLARAFGRRAFAGVLERPAIAAIGPTTSAALAALGRLPDAEAAPATLEGLADAVVDALAARAASISPAGASR